MAKLASELESAVKESAPTSLEDIKGTSGEVPDDFEIDGVDDLIEDTSGPYEPGDTVRGEITFTGQKDGHLGNLAAYEGNYSYQESDSGDVTPKDLQDLFPLIEWEVADDASDGDHTVYATYDEPFNSGATDVGVQQSLTVTVEGYNVDVSASPLSDTEIEVEYDITNGTPDYSVEIYRKLDSDSSYPSTPEHTDTHSSEGTFTWTDSGLDDGTTYDYKVEVTDDTGETVSDEDSATTIGIE